MITFLICMKIAALSIIALLLLDKIAVDRYDRWWRKYGSDQEWQRKKGLPLEKIPPEPWLGRWAFMDAD